MGLFDRLYYGKAGKRDYSEMDMPKNRISLFFMVLKDHVFDLIKVNLMQLIFWIPFLLWTYINLAAVQSIDTETVLSHADGAAELCPAPLPGELLERVRRTAVAAHRCLGLTGYSRADFILTPDHDLYLLEVNTLPGMTAASLVPKEAAALGMDFGELLEALLEDAIRRRGASAA